MGDRKESSSEGVLVNMFMDTILYEAAHVKVV